LRKIDEKSFSYACQLEVCLPFSKNDKYFHFSCYEPIKSFNFRFEGQNILKNIKTIQHFTTNKKSRLRVEPDTFGTYHNKSNGDQWLFQDSGIVFVWE
jgi:hypothetical protein